MSKSTLTTHWIISQTSATPELIAWCGDRLLAELLTARGITSPALAAPFLDPDHYTPTPPDQMPDLLSGAAQLADAIRTKRRILIWGDFDVDGQTSTAILLDGLQTLGADVSFYVPSRVEDGHGIRLAKLQELVAERAPEVLITCDTGIREFESITWARTAGLLVILTDHHELGDTLPNAHAVINPRRLPEDHPLWTLPGAGAAYLLMQETFRLLHPDGAPGAESLLALAAIGVIGDVAMVRGEARYYVQRGLQYLRRGDRIGLVALASVAAVPLHELTATHIGFQLAPRLNAAGRLHTAAIGVELLTTRDSGRAAIIAGQMEAFNNERRLAVRQIETAAESMIAATPAMLNEAALVLHHPGWHGGVLGQVASRLVERYSRPAVLLASGTDGIARGSARAPVEDSVTMQIAALDDLVLTYGGHPGAAGLSLLTDHVPEFRRRFINRVQAEREARGIVEIVPTVTIDAVLSIDAMTIDLPRRLRRLEPFGEGNRAPLFCIQDVALASHARLGKDEAHRRLIIEDRDERTLTLLWWNSAADKLPNGRFDVAVTVGIGLRHDAEQLEVTLRDWHLREAAVEEKFAPTVQDLRAEPDPFAALRQVLPEDADPADLDMAVWAEGYGRGQYPHFRRRAELERAHTLIIFTMPPNPLALKKALEKVQPRHIVWIGTESLFSDESAFLSQLATAAQNVVQKMDGNIKLDLIRGAVAGSADTTFAGLEYLAALEQLPNMTLKRGIVRFALDENPNMARPEPDSALRRFRALFSESAAYRRYARTAPLDALLTV